MSGACIDFGSLAVDIERNHYRSTLQSPRTLVPVRRDQPVLRFQPQGVDRRLPAPSRDPCPRCEIRGDLGCAHQRPFEPPAQPGAADQIIGRRGAYHPIAASVRHPYTPEEDAKVLELRALGLTLEQIGDRIGRTGSSVSSCISRLRAAGRAVPPPADNRPFTPAEEAAILELRALGKTYNEIGVVVDRRSGSIATFFRRRRAKLADRADV